MFLVEVAYDAGRGRVGVAHNQRRLETTRACCRGLGLKAIQTQHDSRGEEREQGNLKELTSMNVVRCCVYGFKVATSSMLSLQDTLQAGRRA